MKYQSIPTVARENNVSEKYLRHRTNQCAGRKFSIRGLVFQASSDGKRVKFVDYAECAACKDPVTQNRHRVVKHQIVCMECHRRAFFEYDAEVRATLGI